MARRGELLIRGACVIESRVGGDVRLDATPSDVLVRDGLIDAIGPRLHRGDARVIDLDGCALLPGFVHLNAEVIPGPVDGDTGPWLFEAVGRLRDLLHRGITTARVLGGADSRWSLLDLRQAVETGLIDGPELLVAPHPLRDDQAAHELPGAVARETRNGADWIAVDRQALDAAELNEIMRTAGDVPVAITVRNADELQLAVEAGARSVEVGFAVAAGIVRSAREHGTWVVDAAEGAATIDESPASPLTASALGTRLAAACLRRDDRGAIERGLRADLVVVQAASSVDDPALDDPVMVIRAGVPV